MFKTALYAATFVGLMGATAMAQTTDPTIQKIFDGLVSEGYTKVEVRKSATGYKVEATSATGKTERRYSTDGTERKRQDVQYSSDNGAQGSDTYIGEVVDSSNDTVNDGNGSDDNGYDDNGRDDNGNDDGASHDRNDDHGSDSKSDSKDDNGNDDDGNDDGASHDRNDDHGSDSKSDSKDDHNDDSEDDDNDD